ncbi:MAG: acyl-CoA/acyl-ACP dehydrogenase [Desulfobacterales bacterium]|jgi:alkylation response protein AidB-like acyl-CoA dehydrogenase|nr:acyl-CoA/acyl-ACP dehydrogenase [Desulfobacterales bacterium]
MDENALWFDDYSCGLAAIAKQPTAMIKEIKHATALARRFNDEVVNKRSLEIDDELDRNPDALPHDWVRQALEWGLYTNWIPKIFGGRGYCFPSLSHFLEEVSSSCLGMANLIGSHYLGIAGVMSTGNLAVLQWLCEDMAESHKRGESCLASFAITEPSSGSDTASADLIDRGSISCEAKKAPGGYILNGTKIFISNAHFATWHMVLAFEDIRNPSSTAVFCMVRTGTKGFVIGKKEDKMGQRACPASELIFTDCFIPDKQVCLSPHMVKGINKPYRDIYQDVFDDLCSISRAGVCALGTGVARGVYNDTLKLVEETSTTDGWLINQEWVQMKLADMLKNAAVSRLIYNEVNHANSIYGLFKPLQTKPLYYLSKLLPTGWLAKLTRMIVKWPLVPYLFQKDQLGRRPEIYRQRTSGWASLAKFAGTDAGVENCEIALQILGESGIRHANRVEKHLRDARLLPIYEGTNQMNRLDLFKNFIGRNSRHVSMYSD